MKRENSSTSKTCIIFFIVFLATGLSPVKAHAEINESLLAY